MPNVAVNTLLDKRWRVLTGIMMFRIIMTRDFRCSFIDFWDFAARHIFVFQLLFEAIFNPSLIKHIVRHLTCFPLYCLRNVILCIFVSSVENWENRTQCYFRVRCIKHSSTDLWIATLTWKTEFQLALLKLNLTRPLYFPCPNVAVCSRGYCASYFDFHYLWYRAGSVLLLRRSTHSVFKFEDKNTAV